MKFLRTFLCLLTKLFPARTPVRAGKIAGVGVINRISTSIVGLRYDGLLLVEELGMELRV